jgi:Zn-dependent protease
MSSMHDILYIIIVRYPLFLFALTIHEFAHAHAADRFGDPTPRRYGRLTLNPVPHMDLIGTVVFPLLGMMNPGMVIFGWARPVPIGIHFLSKAQDNVVSLAGVTVNLIAAFLFGLVYRVLVASGVDAESVRPFFQPAIMINLALFAFNLVPIPPLDGSHVLRNLLPDTLGERYWHAMARYGFLIIMVLMVSGLLFRIIVPLIHGSLAVFEAVYRGLRI